MVALTVSNNIPSMPDQSLPLNYSADGTTVGTDSAIPTVTPDTLGRASDDSLAMGIVTADNVISYMLSTGGTVTVWLFSVIAGVWVKGGGDSSEYSKTVDAMAVSSFVAKAGTKFLLTSTVASTNGYVV